VSTLINNRADKRAYPDNRVQLLQDEGLKKIAWLVHGFSTRPGGITDCYGEASLNLGFTEEDARERVEENRKRFLLELGAAADGRPWPLIANRQIHSDIIHVVRAAAPQRLAGDGLITNVAAAAIAVLTADCLPVLLVDKKNKVVGAFHAGWRGTVKRIVEKGVGAMRHEYGSQPGDIHAIVGPGIQRCCYAVGEELKSEFESQFVYARELFHEVQTSDPVREKYPLLFLSARAPGHGDLCVKLHLDLSEANRRQLLDAGVPEKQITVLGECTACDTRKFFSHRAEKGRTGRMMAAIGIAP
jgi:YfiH family protein